VYNSETLCVEESMHVKFDDKKPGNETSEQGESYADMQVPEDNSEPDQTPESEESPEAQDKVACDEAQHGSQQANQSKNTFKYKSSHLEDQIIGNKDNPKRTRSFQTRRVHDRIVISDRAYYNG